MTQGYIGRGGKIETLEKEKQAIIKDKERLVQNEMEIRKQKEKIKKAIESEKLNFDWKHDLTNSDVRRMLSEGCLSCKH